MTSEAVLGPSSPSHPYHKLWLLGKSVEADLLSIGEAAAHAVPRVHGNGFVQVDLTKGGGRRLHIWGHPAVPAQAVWTGIHDHVYTVASEVLVGRIIDISWKIRGCDAEKSEPHATHRICHARQRPLFNPDEILAADPGKVEKHYDTELVPTGRLVAARINRTMSYGEGCSDKFYMVPAGVYHSSVEDGIAATLMTKVTPAYPHAEPRVLVPKNRSPDNAFSRHAHDTTLLLGVIGEVVPDWVDLLGS